MNELQSVDRPNGPPLGMPVASSASHVAQSTAIEQSRAMAEVQSAMVVAQRFPRNEQHALGRVLAACGRRSLAERAFYAYERGGQSVSDVSIYFAREVARCWGNIQYEIVELSQDKERGESEVMSYAWDLETNVRSAIRFIVPHVRHTRNGAKPLTDPRDIYEMIANLGSRRLRQCILAVIPDDVTQEAKKVCRKALQDDGDAGPISERIKKCVESFKEIGVTRQQIQEHLGVKPENMNLDQLTDMQIIYRTIKGGEAASSFFPATLAAPETSGAAQDAKPAKAAPQESKAQPAAAADSDKGTASKPADTDKAKPGADAAPAQPAEAEQQQRPRGRPSKADKEQAKSDGVRAFHAAVPVDQVPEEYATPSLKSAWESGWYEAQDEDAAQADAAGADNDPPFDVDGQESQDGGQGNGAGDDDAGGFNFGD